MNISRTVVGNKLVGNSDVVGASPVGATPTTSSFSTSHLASVDRANTTGGNIAFCPRLLSWHIFHDDVIKWKYFPRYWPFVRGIHRSPVNSPHKGQWRGALMFCLIRAWINGWVNNCEAGDLRRYLAHCDVIVMTTEKIFYVLYSYFKWCRGWTKICHVSTVQVWMNYVAKADHYIILYLLPQFWLTVNEDVRNI